MASGSNTTYKWDSFKSMPTKRVFSVAVELEDKLYVVGGCDQKGTPLDSFEVFNPKKKQWMMLAHMETKVRSLWYGNKWVHPNENNPVAGYY